jgi:rhodanese-related sulfurtransferase
MTIGRLGYLVGSRRSVAAREPGSGMSMPTVIEREELRTLTGQGAQLAEVLPAEEYAWAHLPGAASVPLKELDARAGQLDRSRPVIVYCHDSL